jgi:hypothetical protein
VTNTGEPLMGNVRGIHQPRPIKSGCLCLIAYVARCILGTRAPAGGHAVFVDEPPRPARIRHAPPPIESRLDPNSAEWFNLMRYPGSAGRPAGRAYRRPDPRARVHRCTADEAPPVFTNPEDLLPIKGIGPKTLEQIRPYLRFDGPGTQPAQAPVTR